MKKRMNLLFIFICTMILYTGCGQLSEEKVWVYDTNQYQSYRRLSLLCANAIPDGQIQEINENELIYEGENISLHVKSEGEKTIIQAQAEDGRLHAFEFSERPVGEILNTGIKATYTDITGDGNRDIVVIFTPVRGTLTGPGGAYLYDVAGNKELKLLENGLYLSDETLEEIEKYLDDDFYDAFPDFSDIHELNAGGMLYVDEFGNLYYEAYITNQTSQMELGRMMIFLVYEKTAEKFSVAEIMYMPYYVSENIDG